MKFTTGNLLALSLLMSACPRTTPPIKTAKDVKIAPSASEKATAPDEGIEVLRRSIVATYDGSGNLRLERTRVLLIKTAAAARRWSTISQYWKPTYDERPIIEATVTSPDGVKRTLDPKTIGRTPARQDANLLTDAMVLRAPLPGIGVGSRIRIRVVTKTKRLLVPEGGVHTFFLRSAKKLSFLLTAPASLHLRYSLRGTKALRFNDRTIGKKRILRASLNDFHAKILTDIALPPSLVRLPVLSVSTAPSWKALARSYGTLVSGRITSAGLGDLTSGLAKLSREQKIHTIFERIQKRVRYTGVEFGEASIIPQPPKTTLARGYGDCKDKSTLLVSALRDVGIKAQLALLRTGRWDISSATPGLESFNHMIVFIPGKKARWIDPSARDNTETALPSSSQDHLALVISRDTTQLVRTTSSTPEDNIFRLTRTIRIAANGSLSIREERRASGEVSSYYRHRDLTQEKSVLLTRARERIATTYDDGKLISYASRRVPKRPGHHMVETVAAAYLNAHREHVFPYSLRIHALLTLLPYQLKKYENSPKMDRKTPLYISTPHTTRLIYHIVPPPGFRLVRKIADRSLRWGPVTYRQKLVENTTDHSVEFQVSLRVPRRFSVAELGRFAKAIFDWGEEKTPSVVFEHIGYRFLRKHHPKKAIKAYLDLIRRYPKEPAHRSLYALRLASLGYRDEAIRQARMAAKVSTHWFPDYALSLCLETDAWGRVDVPGYKREAAIKAIRRAIIKDGLATKPRFQLIDLLQRNSRGVPHAASEKDMAAAHKELLRLDKDKHWNLAESLAVNEFFRGLYGESTRRLEGIARTKSRWPYLIASDVIRGKTKHAIAQIKHIASGGLEEIIGNAVVLSLRRRAYGALTKLMTASFRKTPELKKKFASKIALFGKIKRREKLKLSRLERLVKELIVACSDNDRKTYRSLLYAPKKAKGDQEKREFSIFRSLVTKDSSPEAMGLREFQKDVFYASQMKSEGNAKIGYAITLTPPTVSEEALHFFVVKKGKTFKVAAHDGMAHGIGAWLLVQLRKRRYAALRHGIDWFVSQLPADTPMKLLWYPSPLPKRKHYEQIVGAIAMLNAEPRTYG